MHCAEVAWGDLVSCPAHADHIVQLYQDDAFLAEAVLRYAGEGLRRGEAAILIATPGHCRRFLDALGEQPALRVLDAEETLAKFMSGGTPQWRAFHETVGGLIAELRLRHPLVRSYGEMVDVLWQRGEHGAAIQLEEYWSELAKLQTFSLLCGYRVDNLDRRSYGGPLDAVCRAHTHVIPARDYARFNQAVREEAAEVLQQPLAAMLHSVSANHRPAASMPAGQATLLWLGQNMPRTAEKVLSRVRARLAAA